MEITPIYAALLALLFFTLSVRTIAARRRAGVGIGDAGDKTLARRMRVHANFAEYCPLTLLLIFLLESRGVPGGAVHLAGACLLLGRLSHAYGVSQERENLRFRIFGMALTFLAMVGTAVLLLLTYAGVGI